MKRFAALYAELDRTTGTTAKVALLAAYFRAAPAADAAWALALLTGRRPRRAVGAGSLRTWIAEAAGLPAWLVEECHDHVGDLAETAALLAVPGAAVPAAGDDDSLAAVIEQRVVALAEADDGRRREMVMATWAALTEGERLVYTKLITGGFRVGVAAGLVHRAVAAALDRPLDVVVNRLAGAWQPDPALWLGLSSDAAADPARPFPFALAHAITPDQAMEELGAITDWQIEWKWDGIRAQLIRSPDGGTRLWSRGEDDVSAAFPEVLSAALSLPPGTVLDGEVLAWEGDAPLPFARLQARLGRKKPSPAVQAATPCRFLAYDCLAVAGTDVRPESTVQRRARLEALAVPHSPVLVPASWDEARGLRLASRGRGVEGLMLKRRAAPYPRGRITGVWWKWKIDPFTLDTVMLYAQAGHGRRAGLHTDYTLGVWQEGVLVPIAKAYSGLTDAELIEVDRWVKAHTREKFGPVRLVDPELVFELAFEGAQRSPRHKSGVALRFPRIARWRRDKPAAEADTLDAVKRLL